MKKLLGILLLSACASQAPKPKDSDPQWDVGKSITFEKQSKEQWCGAETARILLQHKGKKVTQTQIISAMTGLDCASSSSIKCAQPIFPQDAIKKFGYTPVVDTTPSIDEVMNFIKAGKPVGIAHIWASGDASPARGAHVVTAVAAYQTNGKYYIQVWDSITNGFKIFDDSYVKGNLAWQFTVSVK